MNSLTVCRAVAPLLVAAAIAWAGLSAVSAQLLTFSDKPDHGQMSCLRDILKDSAWSDDAKAYSDMEKFIQ